MANDEKQPGTNLASGTVILAALVATGAYVFHREAPLLGSRPAITEASVPEQAAAQQQKIDARLWQDPFAAVAKSRDKLGKEAREQQCQKWPSDDSACNSPLTEKDKETLVIGVTVSGAPYSEDAEQRQRTRYAVLAGLERAEFAPRDARHIDYFLWPQASDHAPPSLALEMPLFALQPLLPYQPPPYRNEVDIIAPLHRTVVPYEWFEKVSQPRVPSSQDKNILVLWLEEEALKGKPLQKLSRLIKFLHGQRCRKEDENNINFIGPYSSDMLRDMVSEAQGLDVSCYEHEDHWPELKNVQFYAYGASAPDSQLLGNVIDSYLMDAYGTVQGYFEKLGIHLQRTIATDDTLARGIVSELKRRRVKPGHGGEDHLALISEWDTFYGQTLPQAVERQFALGHPRPGWRRRSRAGLDDGWITKLTYLRGLDGQLPLAEGAEDRKQDKATTQEDKQTGVASFFKTQTDAKSLDRPIGQGQFDYLRRMSEQLRKIDDKLRKTKSKSELSAIGILGSDVFDKLLVLRALRPDFPQALFFTTDFDEAFTMESDLPWTRNLIISSSFGPNLNKKFQGEIPSFRSSYQASAFLATQLAIGDNWNTPDVSSDQLAEQLSDPSIFEIERSGDVLPLAGYTAPLHVTSPQNHDRKQKDCPKNLGSCAARPLEAAAADLTVGRSVLRSAVLGGAQESNKEWPCLRREDLTNCGKIQPVIESLFPTFEEGNGEKLGWSLAGGAVLVLALHYFFNVPKGARVEVWLAVLVLGAGALTCFFWEPIALFLTDYGHGEPIATLQGVSVWPTVLLRILGIILALYFIWRAQSSLRNNLAGITKEMELGVPDEIKPKPTGPESQEKPTFSDKFFLYVRTFRYKITSVFWKKRTLRKRLASVFPYMRDTIYSVFDFSLERDQAAQTLPLKVEAAWRAYVGQERFWPRCCRALIYTVGMFLIFKFVLVPLFGMPINPARGDLAHNVFQWTTRLEVILMLFLTFFVFDATCFCLLFVNKLRRARTEWPAKTMGVYKGRLRLQTDLVHEWIDLEFVAKRTRCISSLIYYPFVLIALLIVSRSTVFANYPPCLTILVAQGISLSVVFGCAIMLCLAAKAARDTAKQNLTDGIIAAKGHSSKVAGNTSDAAQNESDDYPRYAEQLETLWSRVDQMRDGAFSPFSQQPLVRAVLLPLGSFGWTALIQNGMLPGL